MRNILVTVTNHFRKKLVADDGTKAIEFLQEQGITSRSALDAFELGYANAGLTKDFQQFDELVNAKLVDSNGRNRFKSSLTFPLYDLDGNIVDICGQNLGINGTIKTLGDKSLGIGNIKPLTACKEVYVTDYPLIALKLYQEGYKNTVLCPDIHSAKLINVNKVTIVTYKHPKILASAFNVKEVWYTCYNGKDSCVADSFKRLKCLRKPDTPTGSILDRVVSDLNILGYVGENNNKKIAYLIAISRMLKRPLSAIIVSSSGSGKTGLMNSVAELVPNKDKLVLSRVTSQSFYYMNDNALHEKLIIVDERNGSSMADYSIRTMQTSNVLTMAGPKKKGEDSNIRTISVKCAYMESTTSNNINPENASRCYVLHLDETPESTEAILNAQRASRIDANAIDRKSIIEYHHEFQMGLKSLPVILPFANLITFPNHKVSYRREQEKFLGLIEASALLHQADRKIVDKRIIASVEDYKIAYELYITVFKNMEREVSSNSVKLLTAIETDTFTLRDAITATGWNYSMVYRTVRELLQYEYIKSNVDKKGRHTKSYTKLNYKIYGNTVCGLIKPDELFNNFSPSFQHLFTNFSKAHDYDLGSDSKGIESKMPSTFQENV